MIPFKDIQGVCLDIDETLSTRGRLTASAYTALERLYEAGLWVVPITGRPAGWCDQIARFWPVDAVVGENGAWTFFMEDGKRSRLTTPEARESSVLLSELQEKIKTAFPGVQFASDQPYREADLAIDFCEDVPAWDPTEVDRLVAFCRSQGAQAKVSSIHVNTWFGDYDKAKGFQAWVDAGFPGARKKSLASKRDLQWVYIGDSPNDEPMFRYFKYSVGVANIQPFLGQIQTHPTWITTQESGAGFIELADKLLEVRG